MYVPYQPYRSAVGAPPSPSPQCPRGYCPINLGAEWRCRPCAPAGAQPHKGWPLGQLPGIPQPVPPGGCPAGTQDVMGYCVSTGTSPAPIPPPSGASCPPGTQDIYGVCVPVVPGGETPPGTPPPSTAGCPAGTEDVFGICVPIPSGPGTPGAPGVPPGVPGIPPGAPYPVPPGGCPAGTQEVMGYCVAGAVPQVPGQPPSVPREPGPAEPTPVPPAEPGWWAARTQNEKALIIGGAALLGVGILAALLAKKRPRGPAAAYGYNPGGRRPKGGGARSQRRCARVPSVSTCRCSPPAKYARLGATRASDYAFPECFMYPIRMTSRVQTVKHIRAAAQRFAMHGHRYPAAVRREIARNIERAKRQYGIGEYRPARGRKVVSLEAARRRRAKPRPLRKAA